MKFWCVLSGIAAFIALFPYIRCFFKRLICMGKIQKVCRKKGYRLHAAHSFWFLGSKRFKKCDLYIETVNEVFAIKLFGVPRRRSVLILKENSEYFIRSYIILISYGRGVRFTINGKPRPMPVFDFRYEYKDEWEIKTPRHILLVHPVSMEFRRQPRHGSEVIVGNGDIVNGMEMYSLSRFLRDLESAL